MTSTYQGDRLERQLIYVVSEGWKDVFYYKGIVINYWKGGLQNGQIADSNLFAAPAGYTILQSP